MIKNIKAKKKEVKNIKKRKKKSRRTLLFEEIWDLCTAICRKRADGICEICSKAGGASHHHFSKKAFPNMKFDLRNLVWLCFFCHIRRVHQQGQYELVRDILIKKLGEDGFQALKDDAYEKYKNTIKRKIDYYVDLRNELQLKLL